MPQLQKVEILRSNERPGLTPVFGTSTPPSGLSGMLRRAAFKFSENDLRHWLILLFADRVNVGDLDGERLATAATGESLHAVGADLGHPVATSATKQGTWHPHCRGLYSTFARLRPPGPRRAAAGHPCSGSGETAHGREIHAVRQQPHQLHDAGEALRKMDVELAAFPAAHHFGRGGFG